MVSPARMMVFFPRKAASISPCKTENISSKIMAMMRRPAARRNVHVDETVATSGVFPGHEDCVRVSHAKPCCNPPRVLSLGVRDAKQQTR
jgi:hypothetical protein